MSSPESIEEFWKTNNKKILVLYGLFNVQHGGSEKEHSFFEYIEKFLSNEDGAGNTRSMASLDVGLNFALTVLKEIRYLNQSILVNALSKLYMSLSEMTPGILYHSDKEAFLQDHSLNEARDFLVSLVEDASWDNKLVELAYKLIIRIGLARSNPEDFLVVVNLLNKHTFDHSDISLRNEIMAFPQIDGAVVKTVDGKKPKMDWKELAGSLK